MKTILVIGMGAGNPDHLTLQAVKALNRADLFFLMDKGERKGQLNALRRQMLAEHVTRTDYRIVEAHNPERDRGTADYQQAVQALNASKQAVFERLIANELHEGECGAFLVWGDPSLYDSTLRILQAILAAGRVTFEYEVIPGITSVQALAASHKVPLNEIGGRVVITTGRQLAAEAPASGDSLVVMLDAEGSYQALDGDDYQIYWGAYLGMPDEVLLSGPLKQVSGAIEKLRPLLRARNGWVMDSYLLRRNRDKR
ncbi:precorrin-6A synthase (deacetylating) [Pseudomonas sp. HR96]|uniref:precorrin-6A synthase (deacetylating) n=1 Tax=Pseudomonas sp. HR96 TaxID=1027966 RepID=UPI002A7576DB|nr:precorrin-6A synthase (deacetylating) [Pseudomonas sp. HR96]WPO99082.1 precorrin-6A synthase (deacetylating) [Pseudomonas sp. HR96]